MKEAAAYDVFLSFSLRDQGLAHFIADALTEQGLNVYQVDDLRPGVSVRKRIREKLVECSSMVILVTPSSIGAHHLAFEAGMAMAWSKPIYALYDGISASEIPDFVKQFRVAPVADVTRIAEVILKSESSLADEELEILGRIFADNAVPVDRLILQPGVLSDLTHEFNSLTGNHVGGERIARELIRLRKAGKLPKLKPIAHTA